VLHGLAPFSEWHEEHHRRPLALLGTPTLISALLFVCLIYLPLRVLAGEWRASALMLGLLTGYLGYATIHHALHHWHSQHAWFRRRQRWHARHHHVRPLTNYGVSTNVWDRLLHAPE
jgi:cyclopropane-fatty-acyl-phospholipid synthase